MILAALALSAACVSRAAAGTIEFRGTITAIEQPSAIFNLGDSVVLSYTLAEPLVSTYSGPFSDSIFVYDPVGNFLSVGPTIYAFTGPAPFDTEYNFFGQYGPNFQGGLPTTGTAAVGISLYSTSHIVTSPDGILLDGIPLSDFDQAYGRLFGLDGGQVFWNITGYSSTGFGPASVPDTASTAFVLGMVLAALALSRYLGSKKTA